MNKSKIFASVWDALAIIPEQAANLRARAELIQQISALIESKTGIKLRRLRNAV
jgi:predicted XRE-type DNA-binding protein